MFLLALLALCVAGAFAPAGLRAQDEPAAYSAAPDSEAEPSELAAQEPDVWLLADLGPVRLYSLDGDLLGEIDPGVWFRRLFEEDGWLQVFLEGNPDRLFWVLAEQVTRLDFSTPGLSDEPHSDDASVEPEGAFEPTAPPAPTPVPAGTSPPAPTATSASTVAPTVVATPGPATAAPTTTPTAPAAATPSATATLVPTVTSTVAPTAAPASAAVSMLDNSFVPSTVVVRVGGTVTWTNVGQQPHTATRSSSPQSFDSGVKTTGQGFSFTFTSAGTFSYPCVIHGSPMSGQVVVQ